MNKQHQQNPAPATAIVIVVVLMLVVLLLAGCGLVGLMFYRNTTHKAMVAREHALKAEAHARKLAEMERKRAEQMARAAEHSARREIDAAAVAPEAELDGTELQVSFDAEGKMLLDGRAIEWEGVEERLRQFAGHSSSRVVILADDQCRMEPILRLLRAAEEHKIKVTISTSNLEAKETE